MYKEAYLNKVENCEIFLNHIMEMEVKPNSTKVLPILKTSFLLSLYNLVEATVTDMLSSLHDILSGQNYLDLNADLTMLFEKFFKSSAAPLDSSILSNFSIPSYEHSAEYLKLYSGNLDMRKIKEVFKKYGIKISTRRKEGALLIIKEFRNRVMHGEIDFAAGRSKTGRDLRKLFDEV